MIFMSGHLHARVPGGGTPFRRPGGGTPWVHVPGIQGVPSLS
jgi:hypothetical protein